jgi:predicted DNA-binding transcriptional regulator YafY
MPDRHEKLSHALALIMSLAGSRVGLTLRELMAEHDVGLRTLQRMLKAIDQTCHTLEVVETDEREKRWRMRPTPITRAVAITAEEIVEIEAAAQRLVVEGMGERATILRAAASRLRAQATEQALRKSEPDAEAMLASEGIAARPGPRVQLPDGVIAALRRAIIGNRMINLHYRPANGQERTYLLEPYGLLYGHRPYLLALRPGKPDAAVWRLDRILGLTEADRSFLPREGFDLANLTTNSFGIWREDPFDVVLRFSPTAAKDARAWRFHASQVFEDNEDGSLIVHIHAGGAEEMVAHLALWGDSVTVLAPSELAQRLADFGQRLVDHHLRPSAQSQDFRRAVSNEPVFGAPTDRSHTASTVPSCSV